MLVAWFDWVVRFGGRKALQVWKGNGTRWWGAAMVATLGLVQPAVAGGEPVPVADLPDAGSVLPAPEKDPDPWIGLNRGVWAFNDGLDRIFLRPIARGYRAIVPDLLEDGISNFFDNLEVPGTALNQILQGKPGRMVSDVGRFTVNTTIGVLGFFDVASGLGMPQYAEDFGQTMVFWGMPQGPYIMIPIRGPATITHAGGMLVTGLTNPLLLIRDSSTRNILWGFSFLDHRKRLLSAEVLISGDEYLFVRDAYLQRREYLVRDGEIEEDPFLDFEDF